MSGEAAERRTLLGIVGIPGSGKSTLAAQLAADMADRGAVTIPMDGFHLPDAVLAARGLAAVKGAPQTYDVDGLVALLDRLREDSGTVLAPAYSRELHAVVADAIEVPPTSRVIIVEGNYLQFWPRVRSRLDEVRRLDVPWAVARERLIARRVATGRDPQEAREWVDRVDSANAELISPQATRGSQSS